MRPARRAQVEEYDAATEKLLGALAPPAACAAPPVASRALTRAPVCRAVRKRRGKTLLGRQLEWEVRRVPCAGAAQRGGACAWQLR